MGNNSSQLVMTDPTKQPETVLVDQTNQSSTYRSKNGQQYQKYRVFNRGRNDFVNRYEYRIKFPHPYLVKAYFIQQVANNFLCSNSDQYNIVIQRIPHRLTDFFKLASQESINILRGALEGYKQIYRTLGLILVKDSMIGVNKQNQVKVWINPRFHLNSVQTQPAHYNNIENNQKQYTMIENIFQIINSKARKQRLWQNFTRQWVQIEPKTFQRHIQFIQSFIVLNKIPMRALQSSRNHIEQKDAQQRLFMSRKLNKSPGRKLQGLKQSQFQNNVQSPRFSQLFVNRTPRSDCNQSWFQSNINVNGFNPINSRAHNQQENKSGLRTSFTGVRARIIQLPQDQSRSFHGNTLKFANKSMNASSFLPNPIGQLVKTNHIMEYQMPSTPFFLTPQNKNSSLAIPINQQTQAQQIIMNRANKTYCISDIRTGAKSIKVNFQFNNKSVPTTNIFQNIQNNIQKQTYQKQIQSSSQTTAQKLEQNSKKTKSIGSQIKKMVHLKNSSIKNQQKQSSLQNSKITQKSINHKQLTDHPKSFNQSCLPVYDGQKNKRYQVNNPSRIPGKIKHKITDSSGSQLSTSYNQKNKSLIKRQVIKVQTKGDNSDNQLKNKQFNQLQTPNSIIGSMGANDLNSKKLNNLFQRRLNEQKTYLKNQKQRLKIQGFSNSSQLRQNLLDSLKTAQKSARYSRQGISERLNKLIEQNNKSKQLRLKTQQKQTNSVCSKLRNQLKMQPSRTSLTNSDCGTSLTYKDLRNLLRSMHKRNE